MAEARRRGPEAGRGAPDAGPDDRDDLDDGGRAVVVLCPNGRSVGGRLRRHATGGSVIVDEPLQVVPHDTLRMTWEHPSGLLRAFASVVATDGTTIDLGTLILERVDRRRAQRHSVDCPAQLAWHGSDGPAAAIEARTRDLAVLGGSFLTRAAVVPAAGEQIAVRVASDDGRLVVATPAIVVAVDDSNVDGNGLVRMGVEWRLDPRQEQVLLDHVRSLSAGHVANQLPGTGRSTIEVGEATCWLLGTAGLRGPLSAKVRTTGVTLGGIDASDVAAREHLVALVVDAEGRSSIVPMRVVSLAGGRVHVVVD